ncbi:MAG: SusC/RagA family TonB-linked outer membrane protein, partial [Clostridia bacterium]|nr:SusC/RagA family TonB-linked outer membrane protein [Clostridia bacterium]
MNLITMKNMNNKSINQKAHLFYALLKKIPIAMRITLLLLFVLTFQLQAEHIYSQNAKISLDMKNSTIEKVLQTIEEKSDYYFLYNNRLINVDRKVSVRVRNAAISAVLERLFKSENVDYEVKGSQIILSPKNVHDQIAAAENLAQQQQKRRITGTVVDIDGESIIGANIIENGATNGTVTDIDGNFTLEVANNATIRVSYIGYLEQELATQGKNDFNIILREDTKALDEVVVVGYASQKKINLTGSIASVNTDDILSTDSNIASQLQGRLPGVTIT